MKTNIIRNLVACAAVALAIGGVRADEWTDPATGYTWSYQIVDGTADIGYGYSSAVSPSPAGSLTIPSVVDGCVVTGIRSYAFRGCSDLTSVSVPASVTSIDRFAFLDCTSLTDISVAARNQNYKSTGGMLLTKDGTHIVAVPQGRTWVSIPDSVDSIPSGVLNSCPNLDYSWNNGVKSIDGWVLGFDEDLLPRNLILDGYRGIADYAFEDCHSMTGVTIGERVKAIGYNAFGRCYNLASVSLPASVKRIDEDAFYACFCLRNISIAKGNAAYRFENNLLFSADSSELVAVSRNATSVTIPNGVMSVPDHFFAGCSKLTSVTIPASVESIGYDGSAFAGWAEMHDETADEDFAVFYGCPALKKITVAAGNPSYKSASGLLLGMDDGDFYLKAVPQSLTSVTVPEGVTWISEGAFAGCAKLTSITLPTSLCYFESYCLWYGDEFDEIDESSGPYKLTSIKVAAGNEEYSSANGLLLSKDGTEIVCVPRGLTSVTIPASVTEIDADCFEYCAKIKSFSVDKANKQFSAVNGMLCSRDGSELICVPAALKSSTSIVIPPGVKKIGDYAFRYFDKLTFVDIPEGVTEIGDYAFDGCASLANVALPSTLVAIGRAAFCGCVSLASLKIPDGVAHVGAYAFVSYSSRMMCCGWPSHIDMDKDYCRGLFDTNSIQGLVFLDGWLVHVQNSLCSECEDVDEYTEYVNAALQNPYIRGIADGALANCRNLRSVGLPSCVRYIGEQTFENCYDLESVSIPDSVRGIARDAFYGCNNCIDRDSIPGLEIVDGWILKDKGISSYLSHDEYFAGELVISGEDGIRGIADGAFAGAGQYGTPCCGLATSGSGLSGVESLVIGDGVTAIGESSFAFCDDLTNVYVAASVKHIGEKAFYDCRGMQSAMLPDTLKGKVPDSAFANCPSTLKISYYYTPRPLHVVEFHDGYSEHVVTNYWDGDSYVQYVKSRVGRPCVLQKLEDDDDCTYGWWHYVFHASRPSGGIAFGVVVPSEARDSARWSVEGRCRYDYKDDGDYVYGDYVYPSEIVRVESSDGSVVEWQCFTSEDWEYVPGKIVRFEITVKGDMSDSGLLRFLQSYMTKSYYSDAVKLADESNQDAVIGWSVVPDIVETRDVEEGSAIGDLPEIQRDQYRFLGWFTEKEGGESVTADTLMGEEDVALYAHWRDVSEALLLGPFIIGSNVEFDTGFVGYAAGELPTGLKYDAKKGIVSGTAKTPGEYEVTFTKSGEADETVIITVREEEVSVGCEGLSAGSFTAGVAGNASGIPLEIGAETGVKSVAVAKLPAGMKYDARAGLVTGGPTKAGDYEVSVTVTTMSGAKRVVVFPVTVAAAADGAVGTFNGFVKAEDSEENIGTFQLTTTDAGKLTAKVTTAAGSYSFSGACWDSVENGVYSAALTTKKGETLTLSLDSAAGWDKDQLTGEFAAVAGQRRDGDIEPYKVVARKNAFGKTWYFNAEGDVDNGWVLSFAENAKAAALTVTLNADGSTKIAGKLGTLSANASGYADVTGLAGGVIFADFAPVVSIKDGKTTLKRALSIRANLWFDRSNDHPEGVGTAKVVEQ